MKQIPWHIAAGFILVTFITAFILYVATGKLKQVILIIGIWLLLQAGLGLSGFYTVTGTMPPRLIIALFIPLFLITWLLISRSGYRFTSLLSLKYLTLLHTIRIPVELVLYGLAKYKVIPELMTFEGVNFDILSGLSAPFICYFGFIRKTLNKTIILFWNFICLALLLNVVGHAILSVPTPFQQLSFDQPCIAVLYFPYIWLPAFVVPAVFYSHLASVQLLLKKRNQP